MGVISGHCKNCGVVVERRESQVKRSKGGNMFCSRRCAVTYNNKIYKKRKKINICSVCKTPIAHRRQKYCRTCNPNYVDWSSKRLIDVHNARTYQLNSRIRARARRIYIKTTEPKQCIICGYSKHFHVCHIKPIHEFSPDTFISEINKTSNLIALCPTHHWELDNSALEKPLIEYL